MSRLRQLMFDLGDLLRQGYDCIVEMRIQSGPTPLNKIHGR